MIVPSFDTAMKAGQSSEYFAHLRIVDISKSASQIKLLHIHRLLCPLTILLDFPPFLTRLSNDVRDERIHLCGRLLTQRKEGRAPPSPTESARYSKKLIREFCLQDLFVVVHDKVYNATTFIDEHPCVRPFLSLLSCAPGGIFCIDKAPGLVKRTICCA